MPTADDIKWGSYKNFEGPVYYGKHKYSLPENPQEGEKQLLVLTTTEGGTYDAYNGYDVCISTSGLIQWCDRAPYFLVCKMFGYVAVRAFDLLRPVVSLAQDLGYTFRQNESKGWRFFKGDTEVSTQHQQRLLYLGGASGQKGSFTPAMKYHAKRWAAAVSTVWENAEAQGWQREYTIPKLGTFAMSGAKQVIQASYDNDSPYAAAFRAAYVSFAANNPRKAANALEETISKYGVRFDKEWVCAALRNLTFHPNIAIYPHRYDKIRPVLERLYAVDLPDIAQELEAWSTINNFDPERHTPRGLQRALIELGYDVGPAGDDGVWGKRSIAALKDFEEAENLPKGFQDGMPDEHTVPLLRDKMHAKGLCFDFTA